MSRTVFLSFTERVCLFWRLFRSVTLSGLPGGLNFLLKITHYHCILSSQIQYTFATGRTRNSGLGHYFNSFAKVNCNSAGFHGDMLSLTTSIYLLLTSVKIYRPQRIGHHSRIPLIFYSSRRSPLCFYLRFGFSLGHLYRIMTRRAADK